MNVKRSVGWVLVVVAAVVALVIAVGDGSETYTNSERALRLAEQFACPKCDGQSVAQSEIPASVAIRNEIARRVDQGQTDGEITDFLLGTYPDISLKPESSGLQALIWIVPVVGFITAVAGLAIVFMRWRRVEVVSATDDDVVLVERFRSRQA